MPTIKVKIDQYGQPTIETKGFVGSACQAATKSLEEALLGGAESVSRKKTAEFFQQNTTRATVTNRG